MNYLFGTKDYTENKSLLCRNFLFLALLGIALQFVTSFLLTRILDFMPAVKAEYLEAISDLVTFSTPIIIYTAVLAPILEELILRGLAYYVLDKFLPTAIVIVLQAVLFALMHANAVQKAYAFVLGMLLGYIRYQSDNVLSSIAVHVFINSTGLVMATIPAYSEDNGIGILIMVSAAISLAVGIIAYYELRKVWNYTREESL